MGSCTGADPSQVGRRCSVVVTVLVVVLVAAGGVCAWSLRGPRGADRQRIMSLNANPTRQSPLHVDWKPWEKDTDSHHVHFWLALDVISPPTRSKDNKKKPKKKSDRVLDYQAKLEAQQEIPYPESSSSSITDIQVVHEDDDLIVVSKPSGMLSVPDKSGQALNVLDWVQEKQQGMSSIIRPVHRLDRDTSGLVVLAKTMDMTQQLGDLFSRKDGALEKQYEALLVGHLPGNCATGRIDLPLQRDPYAPPYMCVATQQSQLDMYDLVMDLQACGYRKQFSKNMPKVPCISDFEVLQRGWVKNENGKVVFMSMQEERTTTTTVPVTRVSLWPRTGRMHQLRVHCAALGFPIFGDDLYASTKGPRSARPFAGLPKDLPIKDSRVDSDWPFFSEAASRTEDAHESYSLCLHARALSFEHPTTKRDVHWDVSPPF